MTQSIEELRQEYESIQSNIRYCRSELARNEMLATRYERLSGLCCLMVAYNNKGKNLKTKINKLHGHLIKTASYKVQEQIVNELKKGLEDGKIEKSVWDDSRLKEQLEWLNKHYELDLPEEELNSIISAYSRQETFIDTIVNNRCNSYINAKRQVKYEKDRLRDLEKKLRELQKKLGGRIPKDDTIEHEFVHMMPVHEEKIVPEHELIHMMPEEEEVIEKKPERIHFTKKELVEERVIAATQSDNEWKQMADIVMSYPDVILNNEEILEYVVEEVNGDSRGIFQAKEYLRDILKYRTYGEPSNVYELKIISNMILDIEFDQYDGAFDEYTDLALFFGELHNKPLFDEYEKIYNKFMKKNKELPPEEQQELVTPVDLRNKYKDKVMKMIKETLPSTDDRKWRVIRRAACVLNAGDVTYIYCNYRDSFFWKELDDKTKVALQGLFVSLIEDHMNPISLNMTKGEKWIEMKKRHTSVCREYFGEEPLDETYSKDLAELPFDYAKERVRAGDLVRDGIYRYYKQNKLQQVLSVMKLVKLRKYRNKEVLTEEEKTEIRGKVL